MGWNLFKVRTTIGRSDSAGHHRLFDMADVASVDFTVDVQILGDPRVLEVRLRHGESFLLEGDERGRFLGLLGDSLGDSLSAEARDELEKYRRSTAGE